MAASPKQVATWLLKSNFVKLPPTTKPYSRYYYNSRPAADTFEYKTTEAKVAVHPYTVEMVVRVPKSQRADSEQREEEEEEEQAEGDVNEAQVVEEVASAAHAPKPAETAESKPNEDDEDDEDEEEEYYSGRQPHKFKKQKLSKDTYIDVREIKNDPHSALARKAKIRQVAGVASDYVPLPDKSADVLGNAAGASADSYYYNTIQARAILTDYLELRPACVRAIKNLVYREGTDMSPMGFVTSGVLDAHCAVEINGFGPVPLPVVDIVAQQLIPFMEQAPFGHKDKTVIDTTVRKTWQLDGKSIAFSKAFEDALEDTVVRKIAPFFGIPSDMIAFKPHKFLLYDQGAHFTAHRDSEKEPLMFGSLVVELPSVYEGGSLNVEHGDKSLSFSFGDGVAAHYTAFFADCIHDFKPITSGYRAAMTYNLVLKNQPETPQPLMTLSSEEAAQSNQLTKAIAEWRDNTNVPNRLAVLLAHEYTKQSFSSTTLKGEDRVVLERLRRATPPGVALFASLIVRKAYNYNSCIESDEVFFKPINHFVPYGTDEEKASLEVTTRIHSSEYMPSLKAATDLDDATKASLAKGRQGRFFEPADSTLEYAIADDELIGITRMNELGPSASIRFIEHTGNESQAAEQIYYIGAILLVKGPNARQ